MGAPPCAGGAAWWQEPLGRGGRNVGQVCANGGETSAKPGIEFPDDQVDETVIADLQAIDHELKRLLLCKQEETHAALVAELQKFSDGPLASP
jgi:hypothetical protein